MPAGRPSAGVGPAEVPAAERVRFNLLLIAEHFLGGRDWDGRTRAARQ